MIRIFEFDALKPEEILNRDIRAEASVEATTVQEPPATTEAAEPDIIIRSDPETKKGGHPKPADILSS